MIKSDIKEIHLFLHLIWPRIHCQERFDYYIFLSKIDVCICIKVRDLIGPTCRVCIQLPVNQKPITNSLSSLPNHANGDTSKTLLKNIPLDVCNHIRGIAKKKFYLIMAAKKHQMYYPFCLYCIQHVTRWSKSF